jgi:hypothetical protein
VLSLYVHSDLTYLAVHHLEFHIPCTHWPLYFSCTPPCAPSTCRWRSWWSCTREYTSLQGESFSRWTGVCHYIIFCLIQNFLNNFAITILSFVLRRRTVPQWVESIQHRKEQVPSRQDYCTFLKCTRVTSFF